MGKVFITDEVNDMRTTQVTNAGKIKVEDGAAQYLKLCSAQSLQSAQTVSTVACWLKGVVLGEYPATAASLAIFNACSDTASGLEGLTAFGEPNVSAGTANHLIGKIVIPQGQASAYACSLTYQAGTRVPCYIPYNVYCSSGLMAGISLSACHIGSYKGGWDGITIVYQT